MILSFFSLVILIYGLALLFASKIWRKLPEISESGENKSVSIIIPFRNEEENLTELLKSLALLEYPKEQLEIILVNDHSEDDFNQIIQSFESNFPYEITLLSLPEGIYGKKMAIIAGVGKSNSEIILTSDADCTFPQKWVQKMQAPFEINHIQLVSGNVVFKAQNFLYRIFQMEFVPLIGVGAVSIELGNPTMANGANLAFRKSTFEKLNPYANNIAIPSGDDVFLLQKIKAKHANGIFFQKKAVVETKPPKDFASFYQQRKRWAAKWRATSSLSETLPALGIWSFHLLYITAIIYSLITAEYLILLPVLLLKIISEGIFISLILKSCHKAFNFGAFAILQLFYSFYVLLFGLLANFGNYSWKERKYNTNERAGN